MIFSRRAYIEKWVKRIAALKAKDIFYRFSEILVELSPRVPWYRIDTIPVGVVSHSGLDIIVAILLGISLP
jgi:hypothetical protein